MPDESCRMCGGTLIKRTLCAECREVISLICANCGTQTQEQFHDYCFYQVESIQTKSELAIQSGNYGPTIASAV